MRKIFSIIALFTIINSVVAQNVGIGTTTPAAKLDVKAASSYVAQFNGLAPMYMGIFENDIYRGYWGSYSGNPEDVDFGTGSGTTGKLHLTIQANPRLTINNAGLVGIGTTNPNYLLHVNGGDMFVQSSSGSIRFGYDGSNQWKLFTIGGGADLKWGTTTDGTTFTTRHYWLQNGNVGIGTGDVAPAARLHVQTTASEVVRLNGATPYMSFYDNTDGYKGYLWYNGTDMVLGSSTAAIKFASNGYRMTINTDGRISIGSSNNPATGYLLSVDGKLICTEAKVQLSAGWPDYVFGENYKLMPIEDLEKNIRENKHLPNIPSAADVTAEKGIELGEMNRKLLEKVEELTLYIIQLQKQNKELEERMTKMEKKAGGL
jgi:hypothetical protein